MSEFNPFSASVDDAPAVEEVSEEGSSRKSLLVVGAVAAAVAAAGAVFFLTSGGEDELQAAKPVKRAPQAAAAAKPAADPAVKLPRASNLQLGRNPFRALYIAPPPPKPAPPAAPAGSDGGTGTAPQFSIPGTSSPDGAGGGGGATPSKPTTPTAVEHKLVLLRVFGTGKDQSASFSIDGKQQTAKVGTTFGPSAEILLLSLQEGPKDKQWTAVLQVGDGDPFDVVTGEPVFVR